MEELRVHIWLRLDCPGANGAVWFTVRSNVFVNIWTKNEYLIVLHTTYNLTCRPNHVHTSAPASESESLNSYQQTRTLKAKLSISIL